MSEDELKEYQSLLNYKLVHFEIEEIDGVSYPIYTLLEVKTGEIKKMKICYNIKIANYGDKFKNEKR